MQGIYCASRDFKSPTGIPQEKYHSRKDLAWYQTIGSRVPFLGFSYVKRNDVFDRWVVKQLKKIEPGPLHGWNGCSLETFKAAKKLGFTTFVERSCPHNQFQYDILCEEAEHIGVKHNQDLEALRKSIEELHVVDTIVCPSIYSANSYNEPDLIKKVKTVSLGSNFKYKERKEKPEGRLRILMVGNAFLRKGTHYLIEAMKFIEDPEVELWIRGDVPEEYRTRVTDPRIKIFGSLPIKQLFNLYESADVFVQPSVDEGFGMTVLEALSFGLPLVVTENVGAKDIINEKLAAIVPIRKPLALAEAIINVRKLPGKEFDLERKRVLEKYTWALCAKTLLSDVYQI